MDVSATLGPWQLNLPDATQVGKGRDVLINNVGSNTFTLCDSTGSTLMTITSGLSIYCYLTDNSTAAGTWRTFTYGAGTAATAAASLAGNGLLSLGGLIVANELLSLQSGNYSPSTGDRAHVIVATSGSSTVTLPAVGTVTSGYFLGVRNSGSGSTTIATTGGVYIDGSATATLAPTESLFCYTDGINWYTIGHGRSTSYQFTAFSKDLTGLASYTMSSADASAKLLLFSGAPSAATTITIPAVVSVYYVQINTSNAYTVGFKTTTGTTVTLNQNDYAIILCDGVNTVLAQTSSVAPNVSAATGTLAAANGGTGQNSSAWTGLASISGGTWSAIASVPANLGGTGVANNAASTITITGSFASNFTISGAYTYTYPGATSTLAALGVAQTWGATQTFGDNIILQSILKDTGYTVYDKGNVSAATFDIAYTAGSIQTYTATGSTVTITTSAWPPTGNLGEVLLIATNAGAYTHSWPSWNWIKPDGTTTTSIATYLAANTGRTALQSSGVDQILIWTRDAGTTIYAKLV